MFNTIRMSLKIDSFYATNYIIYYLRKLPILHDLITDNIYKSRIIKNIIKVFAYILLFARRIIYRLLYFYIIYVICHTICKDNESIGFVHIFFIFSLLGMVINNKLLGVSPRKYYSIVLFNMDADLFM